MKAVLILGSTPACFQAGLVQSGKRWLLLSGIAGEAPTKSLNPGQALQLHGVILGILQPVSDHIRNVPESGVVEASRG